MLLNDLNPGKRTRKNSKRVGRGAGSGWGKTCGRGHKGYKSRSGSGRKAGFEGGQMPLQMRLPKVGFSSRVSIFNAQLRLGELAKVEADTIDLEVLKSLGVVSSHVRKVKVFASGNIDRAVKIGTGINLTKGARAAIENAGGEIA